MQEVIAIAEIVIQVTTFCCRSRQNPTQRNNMIYLCFNVLQLPTVINFYNPENKTF